MNRLHAEECDVVPCTCGVNKIETEPDNHIAACGMCMTCGCPLDEWENFRTCASWEDAPADFGRAERAARRARREAQKWSSTLKQP